MSDARQAGILDNEEDRDKTKTERKTHQHVEVGDHCNHQDEAALSRCDAFASLNQGNNGKLQSEKADKPTKGTLWDHSKSHAEISPEVEREEQNPNEEAPNLGPCARTLHDHQCRDAVAHWHASQTSDQDVCGAHKPDLLLHAKFPARRALVDLPHGGRIERVVDHVQNCIGCCEGQHRHLEERARLQPAEPLTDLKPFLRPRLRCEPVHQESHGLHLIPGESCQVCGAMKQQCHDRKTNWKP
mmetsp:Transcript_45078/g.130440  ORF Transcript_45078/g.130440 Transcript_45078/m.130440 type:complete len:243 (+) Transcript_45078:1112-1840(+)